MRVSVFGLGYVGLVTAVCVADQGHSVLGVEQDPAKALAIAAGECPIVEDRLPELLREVVDAGRLRVCGAEEATRHADLAFVCVGTPAMPDGTVALEALRRVCAEIGQAAGTCSDLVVAIRSTVPPGTLETVVRPAIGDDVALASNPEFLREGSAIHDFMSPPMIVVGTESALAADRLRELTSPLGAPFHVTQPTTAEFLKYAKNSYHALKVVFANEIDRVCASMGVDARAVMALLQADTVLSAGPRYLQPGLPYGGSCLPKDARALRAMAHQRGVEIPVVAGIPESNERHLDAVVDMVVSSGARRILVSGLSFKEGSDDLRESPAVMLVKRLLGEGITLRIFDSSVMLTALHGSNARYLAENIRHISELMIPLPEVDAYGPDAVVITKPDPLLDPFLAGHPDARVVDLTRGLAANRDT